jgi:hypothetical protein
MSTTRSIPSILVHDVSKGEILEFRFRKLGLYGTSLTTHRDDATIFQSGLAARWSVEHGDVVVPASATGGEIAQTLWGSK